MMCDDIDECSEKPDLCRPGRCINTQGGYECQCPRDYMLSPDGHQCVDMRKEQCFMTITEAGVCTEAMSQPQTKMVCCCSMGQGWGQECDRCPAKDTASYTDLCGGGGPGQIVDPMTGDLQEIDECRMMPGICQHGTCMNTVGSFRCECEVGYQFDEDSHQCVDRNECTSLSPCSGLAQCVNTPGSFYCNCPPGYKLDITARDCRDVNECLESPGVCTNGQCTNNAGSFQCTCPDGFTLTSSRDQCVDIDECQRSPGICGNGTCINMLGSFRCVCNFGFQVGPTGDCQDIDECRTMFNLCRNGRCRNTVGGVTCDCPDGYELTSDGRNCRDKNECSDPSVCPPPGTCQNTMGSHLCTCPSGYRLDNTGNVCEDVNECTEDNTLCRNGFCENTPGGFNCQCQDGWVLDSDKRDCTDVRTGVCYNEFRSRYCLGPRRMEMTRQSCCCTHGQAWDAGDQCQQCPGLDTEEFQVLCPLGPGRGGTANSPEDFNECEMIDDVCEGGTCINTDGSFRCSCPRGMTTLL